MLEGMREQTRQAVRRVLAGVALELFERQGFERTTIDQIAAAAGISRRSFFRYFETKEDVALVHGEGFARSLAEALRARPAAERPWAALRKAFEPLLQAHLADVPGALRVVHLLESTPSLQARRAQKQREWQAGLAAVLVERGRPGMSAVRAEAMAGAAVACWGAAAASWSRSNGRVSLEKAVDDAMEGVASLAGAARRTRQD